MRTRHISISTKKEVRDTWVSSLAPPSERGDRSVSRSRLARSMRWFSSSSRSAYREMKHSAYHSTNQKMRHKPDLTHEDHCQIEVLHVHAWHAQFFDSPTHPSQPKHKCDVYRRTIIVELFGPETVREHHLRREEPHVQDVLAPTVGSQAHHVQPE